MKIDKKKIIVIGGAGLIGSHTVDKLVKENVKEIIIYDNMTRGSEENLKESLSFPTVDKRDLKVSTLITDPQYEHALFSVFSTELPQLKHFIINPLSLLH